MAVIFSCLCIFGHGVDLCGDKSPGRGEVEEKKCENLRFKKRNKHGGLPNEMLRKKTKRKERIYTITLPLLPKSNMFFFKLHSGDKSLFTQSPCGDRKKVPRWKALDLRVKLWLVFR